MVRKQGLNEIESKKAEFMMNDGKTTVRRMIKARSRILLKHPFYGMLLMCLQLGLSKCGTACTDMKNLLFDPSFAAKISDDEMEFVMLHEVLHCALQHCKRGKSFHRELFNIACDIVVNSNILYFLQKQDFLIMGSPVMHLTPDCREGYLFTAEQVYEMLVSKCLNYGMDNMELGRIDSHEIWKTIEAVSDVDEQWNAAVKETAVKVSARGYSTADLPPIVRDFIMDLEHKAKVDWRDVLRAFIKLDNVRFDYAFSPPDERYSDSEFILPSFTKVETNILKNIWFCVDVSGSIRQETLSEIMSEIRQMFLMYSGLSLKISFFDTKVTEPVLCDDEETLMDISPVGGGGTSFQAIFKYLQNEMEELPTAIIILTDGYCEYPEEEEALDIPVLWIIYNNSKDAPWGNSVHVESKIGIDSQAHQV